MTKLYEVKLNKFSEDLKELTYYFNGDEFITDTLYFKKLQMVSVTDTTSIAYYKITDKMSELMKKALKEIDVKPENEIKKEEKEESRVKKVLTDEEAIEKILVQAQSLGVGLGLKSVELVELVNPIIEKCIFFDKECTKPFKGTEAEKQLGFDILQVYGFLLVMSVQKFFL